MRLTADRFSVPFCILEDDLPDKTLRLLLFLFKISSHDGGASAGYRDIREGTGIGSDGTIKASIDLLESHGWFNFIKKRGNRNAVYWLRIPPQYEPKVEPRNVLSIRMINR